MPTVTLVDTTSTQSVSGKTFVSPTITGATVTLAAAPTTALEAATKSYVDGLSLTPLLNATLHASVSGNALTFSLRTAGGSTPSSTDPARVTFRNSTNTDGSVLARTVTGSTTLTFASGSTLGMTSGVTGRVWVGLLDNGGTVEICAWNPYNTSSRNSLKGFTPNSEVTTTAEGSGTATSAHVLYSTNARTAVPFVLLGYIDISEATAGAWATAPTEVITYRDGMKKTGDIVQVIYVPSTAVATGTTVIPDDDTIPQNTEGDQYFAGTITPSSAVNLLDHDWGLQLANNAADRFVTALFQDSTANALAATGFYIATGNVSIRLTGAHRMLAGTSAATTFKIRAGTSAAGTTTLNGTAGARKYGGVFTSYYRVMELCA